MEWTFMTNYAHVLVCLSRDPAQRLRDIAQQVGITERAVQRIVHDLSEAGYITVERVGRRNHYRIDERKRLRHPLERTARVHDLLRLSQTRGD